MLGGFLLALLVALEIRYRLHKPRSLAAHCDISLPVLCTHRGHGKKGKPPENTLAAFRASEQEGFFMHELDVRQNSAGNLYLFHGPYLDGQTDGEHKRIEESSEQEIRSLNFAHYLQDGSFEPATELQLYLQEFSASFTNIEIKRDAFDFNFSLEKKVSQTVKQFAESKNIFVSGFHFLTLFFNYIYFPHVPRGILFSHRKYRALTSLRLFFLSRLFLPDSIHAPDSFVDEKKIAKWKKKNFNVIVWTINSSERACLLFSWGADVVITDNISLAHDLQIQKFCMFRH